MEPSGTLSVTDITCTSFNYLFSLTQKWDSEQEEQRQNKSQRSRLQTARKIYSKGVQIRNIGGIPKHIIKILTRTDRNEHIHKHS